MVHFQLFRSNIPAKEGMYRMGVGHFCAEKNIVCKLKLQSTICRIIFFGGFPVDQSNHGGRLFYYYHNLRYTSYSE